MILGNIGIVSSLSALYLTFRGDTLSDGLAKLGIAGVFLILLVMIPVVKGLDNVIDTFITRRLRKLSGFSMGNYSEMVRLASGYGIGELYVVESDELAGKKLHETGLTGKNILVLAIKRGFHLVATPKASELIRPGDRLVCFGHLKSLSEWGKSNEEEKG